MKKIIVPVFILLVVIVGALAVTKKSPSISSTANNVSMEDGKQIITIDVKGGYHPQKSVAKSGVPTIIRFTTSGTFDCSSSIRIPSMDISKSLPQTGTTDIDIGTRDTATLSGTCGMGMYHFAIDFKA